MPDLRAPELAAADRSRVATDAGGSIVVNRALNRSPVDSRTGLVRWVNDIPIEPGEPNIFNASVKMADISRYNPQPCYDNNGGSGLTREQARNAAIGEGLERYCCAVYNRDNLLCGTVGTLCRDHEICPPQGFALFHPDQPGRIPRPDENTPIAWVWGWSLSSKRPVLVPASLVYMPYFPCFPEQGEQVAGPTMSTGLACARSTDEAVLRGAYECVERDSVMIMWMNRLPVPRVDIRSHPRVRRLYEERLQRDGLRYILLQTTTDIPIPSFFCLLIDERRSPPMISAGGAASLDPAHAAAKAMTEAVQTREWAKFLGARGRKFEFAVDFSDIRDFEDHVALYAFGDMLHAIEFLLEEPFEPLSSCWESAASGDTARDLERVVAIFAERRMDVIALDLTTPDVAECGLRVTRAMIPALQPLDADYLHRFLGGHRLYEVPCRMGYTEFPTTIENLNPYPHPYP
jgi:ribosomal protein S12 methylthiotransferase accessory factor